MFKFVINFNCVWFGFDVVWICCVQFVCIDFVVIVVDCCVVFQCGIGFDDGCVGIVVVYIGGDDYDSVICYYDVEVVVDYYNDYCVIVDNDDN